jgi:hypothetical protein
LVIFEFESAKHVFILSFPSTRLTEKTLLLPLDALPQKRLRLDAWRYEDVGYAHTVSQRLRERVPVTIRVYKGGKG